MDKKDINVNANTPVELNEVLASLPEDQRNKIQSAIFSMVEERHFSGPLPAPEDFAKYEKMLPGSADRILRMAEKQSDHRIKSESMIIDHKVKVGERGQILGFILVVLCIATALILGLKGHDVLARWIGVTTVTCVAVVFVLNKIPFSRKNEE